MTHPGSFKVVFCLLISVILCFMNYSLHYQYGTSSSQPIAPQSSQVGRTFRKTSERLGITSNFVRNTNLPTEAALEANTPLIQNGDFQRTTEKLFVDHYPSGGTDTGNQVVIQPPTMRQPPSMTYTKTEINQSIDRAFQVHDTQKNPSKLQSVDFGYQTAVQQSSNNMELAGLRLTNTTGFVIALRVYEQQTMASGNLMQLQCWAKLLNLAVVKPFTKDSLFSTPLDETKQYTMLTLDETFDMDDWSQHAVKLGYAPLIDWHYFVQNAPRDVIVVQIKYPTLTHVKSVHKKGLPFPHPPSGEEYKEGCGFKMLSSGNVGTNLKALSFRVVRKVCFNFLTGDELSLKQFHMDILGDYQPGEVTIIIDDWRGIKENQRILIQDDFCKQDHTYREHLKPSQHLLADAQAYTEQFLQNTDTITSNSNTTNKDYLAIIARYEMTGLTRNMEKDGDPHAIIPHCLGMTLKTMEEMQQKTGLSSVFLSIDIGKYGSRSFALKHYYNHLEDMEAFVRKVYRGKMDIRAWEKTFETATHISDAGYIAMLQQMLVVRAKCIIFVGGGSFQRHAFNLYSKLHPDEQDQCYKVIEKCTTPYRPIHSR